ncbi:sensor domain-containing diguanylate cyclase [Saccharibacillus sacchari]|uniref:sensor domain-containing diguanylate cyclase n=1 Tax=Saccharibacillus sacchari TaxID=456493 RepID=UPI0004AE0A2E|nr:sensor domain-containing diguanylate cyclase [Saccharibacillus sacchari]
MNRKAGRFAQGIKLSTVIGLLSIFILLSAAGIGSYMSYINGREALAAQTLRLNEYHAGELARISSTAIETMQKSLLESADYIMSTDSSPEMIQRNLDYFRKSNGFFNSVVIINDSSVLTYSTPDLGLKGTTITTPQLVKALAGKTPSISAPYIAPTGRYIVTVSQPLFSRDGMYHGMLAGSIYLKEENRLGEILGTQNHKDDGSYFYVIDQSGKYMYHPNEQWIGKEVSDTFVRYAFSRGGSGSATIDQQDGKRFLAGHAMIPQTGWCVVFQTPYANVLESAEASTFETGIYMLPAVVVVLLMTLYVSHKLSMPLHTLALYTENMANRKGPKEIPNVEDWNYETKMLKEAILLAERKSREAEAYLLREANHDPLTGLLNRRTLESLTDEWMQQNKKFSVVFLDIDHFKSVNDTYGHQKGDEVLREMGAMLSDQIGINNHCFRYGGEEFVLLLSNGDEETAMLTAERIRTTVEISLMPIPQPITVSLGIAIRTDESTSEILFRKADLALYRAKESGRNRSVIFK